MENNCWDGTSEKKWGVSKKEKGSHREQEDKEDKGA